MKGMELAKAYYREFGEPMLREKFPNYLDRIAVGLVGEGSECYGYDDSFSQDHDFGPGFCLWLDEATAKEIGQELQDAYDRLPGVCQGYVRNETPEGKGRVGVFRIDYFYQRYTNCGGVPENNVAWLNVPERFLSIATNGEVFTDPQGKFTAIRNQLLACYPEDVLRKKLAARAALMAQAGQYNYPRCMNRGERGAAFMALNEFVRAGLSMMYLLNKRYMPFYKWSFRGSDDLPLMRNSINMLRELTDPSVQANPQEVQNRIEQICIEAGEELRRQGYSSSQDAFLTTHCPSIMAGIQDPRIRQLHVMADCEM